ncbi:hypothetical protein ACFLU6_14820 [Acidobacteriota bacterium]
MRSDRSFMQAVLVTSQSPASRILLICALLTITFLPGLKADDYDDFNQFCLSHFGAESEEEIYLKAGQDLVMIPGGEWAHISETSAVIAWETNLPARSRIEYGTTAGYGSSTQEAERPFFLHLHYVKDLQPATEYHYRLVSTDERNNTIVSGNRTFMTQTPPNLLRVPQDLVGSPPYLLDQADMTYLVTEDITADSTVFNVAASGITLDLGGHTIVYDNVAGSPDPIPSGDWSWYATQGPCGIRAIAWAETRILNGTVLQGAGNGTSDPASYNPLFLRRPQNTEVAGITAEYTGAQVSGIMIDSAYEGTEIHHNVIVDRGTEILDRHRGLDGIFFDIEAAAGTWPCHHNLLKRVRHRGIHASSNHDIYANEIYIDSWATNSYGIMYYSSGDTIHDIVIHENRIFGTGYHPIGIGSGYNAADVSVSNNYIQMQGQAPTADRWPGGPGDPTGQEHPVNGIRFHQGPQQNIDYAGNTVVVKGRGVDTEGLQMRGLWVAPAGTMQNVVFRNNRIKQVAENDYASGRAVAALGAETADETCAITYQENTILANTCNVRFGDNYGHGARHHFISTTLGRIGSDPRYRTIILGWEGWVYETYGHTFLDSTFLDGASHDEVSFEGALPSYYDFTVLWTLTLRTLPGAGYTIEDAGSTPVHSGTVGPGGEEIFALTEYLRTRQDKAFATPHTVTVTGVDPAPIVVPIVMDQPRILEIYPSGTNVLRNDEIRLLSPVTPELSIVFADLRASAPYMIDPLPGVEDTDTFVITDSTRPLVLYELTNPALTLSVTETAIGTLRLDW